MYTNEFVTRRGDVKIRLLLIDEERIGYPNVSYELWSNGESFNTWAFLVGEPRVGPKLSKIKVQCKILERNKYYLKVKSLGNTTEQAYVYLWAF